VKWNEEKTEKEAGELIKEWAPIELTQALPLLSSFFSLNDVYRELRKAQLTETVRLRFKEIRKIAVEALKKEPYNMVEPVMA